MYWKKINKSILRYIHSLPPSLTPSIVCSASNIEIKYLPVSLDIFLQKCIDDTLSVIHVLESASLSLPKWFEVQKHPYHNRSTNKKQHVGSSIRLVLMEFNLHLGDKDRDKFSPDGMQVCVMQQLFYLFFFKTNSTHLFSLVVGLP